MTFSAVLKPDAESLTRIERAYFDLGRGCVVHDKSADVTVVPAMSGNLYVTEDGWGMLSVPNAIGRGAFDAMNELGIQLPTFKGKPYNAHITVFRPDELDEVGGPTVVSERGHRFKYNLGPIVEIDGPKGQADVSKVWAIRVKSSELEKLRKSYGLTPLPNGDHEFHITFAVRKKQVLLNESGVTKHAGAYELSGKVQHVGLRRTAHGILDRLKMPGLAVNGGHDGKVRLLLPGTSAKQDAPVLRELDSALQTNPRVLGKYAIKIIPQAKTKLRPVRLDDAALENYFAYIGHGTNDSGAVEAARKHVAERYRLRPDRDGAMVGEVDDEAYRQLMGLVPSYKA